MIPHDRGRAHPPGAALARRRGVEVRFVAQRGKGSHGTLYFGSRKTIVKDRKKELSSGLLAAMLDNLGIELEELRKRR